MKLFCANQRYSSWSFRVWLAMKQFGVRFETEVICLRKPDTHDLIDRIVPGARLPILEDGSLRVWESLAILEYLAEKFPGKNWWPASRADRSVARAISNEMHSGFMGLRTRCPMNCFARPMPSVPEEALADIRRISQLWKSCLAKKRKGGFLFGPFSIADAMYAPVAVRLTTYGVGVEPTLKAYMARLLTLPASQQWFRAAALEEERIPAYEL